MANHGVFVSEKTTNIGTPIAAESGVPYIVGTAPVWMAEDPAGVNNPVVCHSWAEAVKHFGYSTDWATYTLCEAMYVHFRLYNASPIILCNVLSSASPAAVEIAEKSVSNHKITMPLTTLNDASLVVKTAASGDSAVTLVKGTDYAVYYTETSMIIELLSGSEHFAATTLFVACNQVGTNGVDAAKILAGIEAIELCATSAGIVPDLLLAPGWSHESTVAAAMAAKAGAINGLFKAKAVVDLDCSAGHAVTYTAAVSAKQESMNDANLIVCWPMVKNGDQKFHMSLHVAGVMAKTDTANGGVPYESPSSKAIAATGICLADGTTVNLTMANSNALENAGIVTAMNLITSGWKLWGNYTAAYPDNTDVKDCFIPISRMFSWIGNSVVQTFWTNLDMPLNRRLVDTIIDTANIWLNSLVGSGYLLGARIELDGEENALQNLMNGIVKVHIYLAPPAPAQEIDFSLEYDVNYVTAAFAE